MDEELRFEQHVNQKIGRCFGALRSLYNLGSYLNTRLRLQLCNALVLPHLQYCEIVFGPRIYVKTSKAIQRVQNSCMRFCFRIRKRYNISPYLVKNKQLNMANSRHLQLACFVQSLNKFGVPTYLFEKKCLPMLRDRGHLYRIPVYTLVGTLGCFKYAASKVWNDLPPPVRDCHNLSQYTFRKNCLNWFLSRQALEVGVLM